MPTESDRTSSGQEDRRFSGTEPFDAGGVFSVERLEAYLASVLADWSGSLRVERFRGGQSNPTLLLYLDERPRFVLRKKPAGTLLPSAHAVDREFRVMRALAGSDVPVPRVYHLCVDESIIGTIFYIMDYVAGRTFWDPTLPDLTTAERATIYGEMNGAIARLHRVDYTALSLAGFGRPEGYVARQVERWSKQYRASQTERIEAMESLMAWLPENVPAERPGALLHGDFRLDNLVFHPTEPKLLAILDWELSTLGDPLADFAYHMLTWRLPRVPYRGLADANLEDLGIPDETAYRDAYLQVRKLPPVSERDWLTYLSYSLFRIAAIRQGIMRRFVDGNASSASAREAGALAAPSAEIAWSYAQRAAAL